MCFIDMRAFGKAIVPSNPYTIITGIDGNIQVSPFYLVSNMVCCWKEWPTGGTT